MATTANVLTVLGDQQVHYREMNGELGILVTARAKPKMITPGLEGYHLGLYDEEWATHEATPTGAATYYVRIVPIYDKMSDPDGNALRGTPNTRNTNKGTTFNFDPFPDGYGCTGYEVYAGTGTADTALYKQGELTGRFTTYFVVGTTWTLNSTKNPLSANDNEIPPFADAIEVYQAEGDVNSRVFLGGGKKYDTGYAKVIAADGAPSLACGTGAENDYTVWELIRDASFRMRIDNEWFDFVGIDFDGDASMADVAATLEEALQAPQLPKLVGGDSPTTTIATWTAIADGSFNVVFNGTRYDVEGCDFTSVTTMHEVADVIDTQLKSDVSTMAQCRWDATAGRFIVSMATSTGSDVVVNGGFAADSDWDKGSNWAIAGGVAKQTVSSASDYLYQDKNVDLTDKTWVLRFRAKRTGGTYAYIWPRIGVNGNPLITVPETACGQHQPGTEWQTFIYQRTLSDANAYDSIVFRTVFDGTDVQIDDVELYQGVNVTPYLSYLSRHSSGTGTDISTHMACRGTSDNVVLNRKGKDASDHTVSWSTDHFVIADTNTGDEYRLSFLEAAVADVGTDISAAAYMDGLSSSTSAAYTPGYTAQRSVVGTGVDWGEWAKGMRFRLQTEGYRFLVAKQRESNHLVLDEDYSGDGFEGFQEYVLEPINDQVYVSNLGNPFRFDTGDIVKLPTADSDGITSINRVGHNIGVFMKHHTWLFNSADITAPRLISNQIGAWNAASVIEFQNGVAMFTGEDFVTLQGGRLASLDPEGRVREIIDRMSDDAPAPHGVYLVTDEARLLMWFMGLDSATVINTAVVYDTVRGNWWLYNVKDVRCSVVLRDANDRAHLVTGSSYDAAHGINAYTWLHGIAYRNDGAQGSITQGVIAANGVGNPTETAGYLTCAAAGSSTIGDWNAVTDGYFAITIDGTDRNVGPCDFSGDSDMDGVATTIENAIASAGETSATVAWSTDHFVITSGTLKNTSDVLYLRPYYPSVGITDLSAKSWMNGRDGQGTLTRSVSEVILTLKDMDNDLDAGLYTTDDGEEGCYLYICDTNMENGQYLKVVTNTANTVTVTPNPSSTPAAGWYWFMGGIVPTWTKWFDFGSPQHKNKVHGVAVAIDPGEGAGGNRMALHGMQDLSSTVRTKKVIALGGSADTVNSFHLRDQYATQQGLKFLRPNSEHDLKLRSITVTHSPRV